MAKRPIHFNRTAHLPQNVRVEDFVRDALDKYAADMGMTTSSVTRLLIAQALANHGYLKWSTKNGVTVYRSRDEQLQPE